MILVSGKGGQGKAWALQGDVTRVFPERWSLGGTGAVWSCGMGVKMVSGRCGFTRAEGMEVALIRNGSYLKLASAMGVSSVGDGIRLVAAPLLASTMTPDPLLISLVVVANRLPWLLFGLAGGVVADRFKRKSLMVLVDLSRCVLVGALAGAVFFDLAGIWVLAVVSFCLGVGETVFSAANQGMIPEIVEDPDDLSAANGTFYAMQAASMNFIGPGLGGLLFGFARWLPFLIDAVSFLLASALVARIAGGGQAPGSGEVGMWQAVREGVAWCRGKPVVVALLSVMGVVNFAQSGVLAVMVIYVTNDLGASATAFGVVLSISGAGGVLGGALASVADRKLGFSYVLPVGVALAGPLLLLMIASSNLVLLAGCLFFNSFFGIMVSVLVASLRQKIAPRELAGRVASVQAFIAMGIAMPGGALLGGVTAELLGVRSVFILSGALCLLLSLATARNLHPRALKRDIAELMAKASPTK